MQGLVDWLQTFKTDGLELSFDKAKEKADLLGIDINSGFNYRVTRYQRPRRFEQNDHESQIPQPPPATYLQKFISEVFDEVLEKIIVEINGKFDAIEMVL